MFCRPRSTYRIFAFEVRQDSLALAFGSQWGPRGSGVASSSKFSAMQIRVARFGHLWRKLVGRIASALVDGADRSQRGCEFGSDRGRLWTSENYGRLIPI